MKILLLGTFTRGNASVTIKRALERYAEVIPFAYRDFRKTEKRDREIIERSGGVDLVCILKGDHLSSDLINACNQNAPTLLWYMDAPRTRTVHNMDIFGSYGVVNACTYVACSLYDGYEAAILKRQEDPEKLARTFHIDDGFDPEWDKPVLGISQDIIAGFVGSLYGDRYRYLRHVNFVHRTGFYCEDLAHTTAETQCNLNFTRSGIWQPNGPSVRTYKLLAHKGFVLCEEYPHPEKYGFKPGRDLITFLGWQDLKEKIEYYKNRPDERFEIAEQGYKTVQNYSKYHTFDKLLRLVGLLKGKE